jgi:hypothetical protein
MRVLAIDPGPEVSGLVILEDEKIVHAEVTSTQDVLTLIEQSCVGDVDLIACEMIASYGMAVGKEVFDTCVWIGRLEQAAHQISIPFEKIFRKTVVMHHCNSPRGTDANIRMALIDRLGPQGKKTAPGPTYGVSSHAWAALAVGLYAVDFHSGKVTK